MVEVEGYKAFNGVMKITPKCQNVAPFELEGDWLYKPDTDCWYGSGKSFVKEICEIVRENKNV
jgi:hypothetical protein